MTVPQPDAGRFDDRIGGYADGFAPKVVSLGGGHGLSATLSALRFVTSEITAIVTVADDGGSSGRIRRELPVIPPGDLRMALAALAGDDAWGHLWEELLQHRFGGSGALAGHPVGNLVITGLMDLTGDAVAALDAVGRMIGAVGRVLPMSAVPLEIIAEVAGIDDDPSVTRTIRGQVAVAATPGRVESVSLMPEQPPACPQAVAAVLDADAVILGPGSWFTSVLPHLLVPELRQAMVDTAARRIVVLNLAPQPGETEGFTAQAHLEVLHDHAPDLPIDVVVADTETTTDPAGLQALVRSLGGRLILAPVAMRDRSPRHDPLYLADVFRDAIGNAVLAQAAQQVQDHSQSALHRSDRKDGYPHPVDRDSDSALGSAPLGGLPGMPGEDQTGRQY